MILIDLNGNISNNVSSIWKKTGIDGKWAVMYEELTGMVVLKEGISGEEAVDMMNWIVMQLREQRDRRHIILDIRAYMRSH